ncbi:MAG: flagellar assembly peptidoglycan hydrolase FlgJ, partial [Gallionellaceae bacterium]|nr:flagellar assembly peptidoglycan hydrolase FlgJ [Gallionellaceae bacterium]
DTQSLEQLRGQARHSPDQALKAAAQQFESVFLNMMLKSMRDATPQDGMFDSEQTKMFTGMLDQQLAQNMSSRGVGLADMMVKQLSRGGQLPGTGGVEGSIPAPDAAQRRVMPSTSDTLLRSSRLREEVEDGIPAPDAAQRRVMPSAYNQGTQQGFIDRMTPYAIQASQATGVPAQLMLGQAALESGWGKREIRMADGSNSFNLFAIKASAGWGGKTAEILTTEYVNGIPRKQVEKFRAYSSYAEAFQDYAGMMAGNPRYARVLQQGGSITGMAQAVQNAGYATDPGYADKLARVMGQLGLNRG